MINNKAIGTAFEQEFCEWLSRQGYWVHFIVPDARGAQPFDVIAAKDGIPYVYDCKTCVVDTFNINRLEDNQIMAFNKWISCGNTEPHIVVKHKGYIFMISFSELKQRKSIKLDERLIRYEI